MNKKLICLSLIITIFCPSLIEAKPKKTDPILVRGCQNWGFFAEFLWVINHLQWCETQKKIPVVYWHSEFAYYAKNGYNGSKNPWEYYFEPVSNYQYTFSPKDTIYREGLCNDFSSFWSYFQYIENIHLLDPEEQKTIVGVPVPFILRKADDYAYPTNYGHPYSKNLRHYVKSIIDKYIRIKPSIQKKIDTFYTYNMKGYHVIGIHLRGGFIWNEVGVVPLEIICDEANKVAQKDSIFFIATDQKPLLEAAKKLLKGKVIAYDAYRQETTTSPFVSGQWPPEMGEDVLIETLLLSKCSHLIHTISNVSTAALYFNSDLPHTMLYCAGANK